MKHWKYLIPIYGMFVAIIDDCSGKRIDDRDIGIMIPFVYIQGGSLAIIGLHIMLRHW